MDNWSPADTNTHQDHVIAHVIGATVEAYFVWDETAYLVLDIGFVWNIYLDIEMGLVPQVVAIAELDASGELPAGAEAELLLAEKLISQDMEVLLSQIREHVTSQQLVVSFAAGIRTSFVEKHLPDGVHVVRVMSNVAVLVDEAMSVVAAGSNAEDRHLEVAEELLGYVGRVIRLKEVHLDAITATSGSGPAYFFLLAEAMIEACILLGLSRDVATELIIQTMLGSAKMLRDTGKHPVVLREMVTSPGGTTIAAIRHLEEAGVRAAFLNAIDAACRRSAELAQGGDEDET